MSRPATLIEPGTVKLERLLPGPIERVWAYITESDKREKWLCSGHFDLRVGGNVELRFDNSKLSPNEPVPESERGRHAPKAGVITRLEPPHLLAHTWVWDTNHTEVTYQLAERGFTPFSTSSRMPVWTSHPPMTRGTSSFALPRLRWTMVRSTCEPRSASW